MSSQDAIRRFEQTLGNHAPRGLEMLRVLEREHLPFTAIEDEEEKTMVALVQEDYVSPDSWCRVYFINNSGLQVVDAYKER